MPIIVSVGRRTAGGQVIWEGDTVLRSWGIGTQLLVAFGFMAILTAMVGAVNYGGLADNRKEITQLIGKCLKSLEVVLSLKVLTTRAPLAQRKRAACLFVAWRKGAPELRAGAQLVRVGVCPFGPLGSPLESVQRPIIP